MYINKLWTSDECLAEMNVTKKEKNATSIMKLQSEYITKYIFVE